MHICMHTRMHAHTHLAKGCIKYVQRTVILSGLHIACIVLKFELNRVAIIILSTFELLVAILACQSLQNVQYNSKNRQRNKLYKSASASTRACGSQSRTGTDNLHTSTVHFFAASQVSCAPTITHGLHCLSYCSTNSSLLSSDWTILSTLSFTVSFPREKLDAYLCRVQPSSHLSSMSVQNPYI